MANLKVGLQVKGKLAAQLREIVTKKWGKKARNTFADFRPFIEEAIDEGVINSRENFIPTDDEAAELGVGKGGNIDREKTQGAWRELLVDSPSRSTVFSVRKTSRKNQIGEINVRIDEAAFFGAPPCNVEIDDSFFISNIPWMNWLIEGAETNPEFEFNDEASVKTRIVSRTGRGIMVQGGIWAFEAANPNAFRNTNEEIDRQIGIVIRRNIGKVL